MTENDEEEFEGGLALNILCGAYAGIVLFLMMLRDISKMLFALFIGRILAASITSIVLLPIVFILKYAGIL